MKPISVSGLTIRQRLPLLICTLLLSMMLVFGVVSYLGVRKAALGVGQDRLVTLSSQLSNMLSGNTHTLLNTAYLQANKGCVGAYILSNKKDSVTELTRLLEELQTDTTYVQVSLLDSDRKLLLNSSRRRINIPIPTETIFNSLRLIDSGTIGRVYAVNDAVFYPIIATVKSEKRNIGYLLKWKKMQARSVDQLSQLMGSDARLCIGNLDGSLWTNMSQSVPGPAFDKNTEGDIIEYQQSGKTMLASVRTIPNSQWLISVEFPKSKILQTSSSYLYWLSLTGTVLLLAGIFFGWLMSRNISRPLVKLTEATSSIAAGAHSSPVLVNRLDEVGKLARAFNDMSVQVVNAQKVLEQEAENYKLLFEKNPMPMWILSSSTLFILDVNDAAISHYGYCREEFLKLNSKDIRPAEDVEKFMNSINRGLQGRSRHEIWRHRKKDGTIIMVDIIADDIVYKNQPARLILAHDVTEKLKAEAELVRHRLMQQEIITETTILVQEKEREEIGKELHDNINQILTSTKLYLEMARNGNKELATDAISKSYDNVNLAIGEIRQLSKQLVKPAFDTTLTDSLRDLTEELKVITPIEISFTCMRFDESLLDETLKLMIYRVVQEQLNNILKHAAASDVHIRMETDPDHVYLLIEDNGVGFDMTKKPNGIGLRNIDNRVRFHKGQFSIHSHPGQGCKIEIKVPLKAKPFPLYH